MATARGGLECSGMWENEFYVKFMWVKMENVSKIQKFNNGHYDESQWFVLSLRFTVFNLSVKFAACSHILSQEIDQLHLPHLICHLSRVCS